MTFIPVMIVVSPSLFIERGEVEPWRDVRELRAVNVFIFDFRFYLIPQLAVPPSSLQKHND
jgi:hypothetical protein